MKQSIIFDLGAVLVNWNPQAIARGYTDDQLLQQQLLDHLFFHQNWIDFDSGLINERLLITQTASLTGETEASIELLMQQVKEYLTEIEPVRKLLEQATQNGIACYCLSNISHELFDYLKNRHGFFSLFDGIVISAEENCCKPDRKIFDTILERYQLDPQTTLFIDDREDNTLAAAGLGIHTLTFTHSPENLQQIESWIHG